MAVQETPIQAGPEQTVEILSSMETQQLAVAVVGLQTAAERMAGLVAAGNQPVVEPEQPDKEIAAAVPGPTAAAVAALAQWAKQIPAAALIHQKAGLVLHPASQGHPCITAAAAAGSTALAAMVAAVSAAIRQELAAMPLPIEAVAVAAAGQPDS